MSDLQQEKIINSWHERADAYERLIGRYRIFTDMAMTLVRLVEKSDAIVLDLAAGTGLVSRLLLERGRLSASSLYLIEPARQMCVHARKHLPQSYIYQIAAEDCLSIGELRRGSFDFVVCNASMHLMCEEEIFPIVEQLLKPRSGSFLYTLWYHAFDETANDGDNEEFEDCVNQALSFHEYPKYFSRDRSLPSASGRVLRSRNYLEETAEKFGLRLDSCEIFRDRIDMQFDLDFLLMRPDWLDEHLTNYEWTQKGTSPTSKQSIIDKIEELIRDKSSKIAFVRVVVSRQ
jgi:SAM-dependent methyltransferase